MAARNNPKAFADWYEQDYFRRRRRPWVLTAVILAAMIVAGLAVAAAFVSPHGETAFQAGPLSAPHAFLADNCAACHTAPFATARRLWPGNADVRATPDEACLGCHRAGVHHPNQMKYIGPADAHGHSAAGCAECHREHRGGNTIAPHTDEHCVKCHRNVETADGEHRFGAAITHFDTDHPDFGAWRGGPPRDPGTLKFNHKKHLELAKNLNVTKDGRDAWMAVAAQRLHDLSCTACHEPDDERKYIRPVRYDAHCATCHPLRPPAGDPDARLHHPKQGQSAADVRAELQSWYWKQLAIPRPAVAPREPAERPPVLNRPMSANQKALIEEHTRKAEIELFDPKKADLLPTLERLTFDRRAGCAECHEEATTPETRTDRLPTYKLPGLRGRWNDVPFPHERFGKNDTRSAAAQTARDRWFPYSRFSHESHRLLDCQSCHLGADKSEKTSDVLMPGIDTCKQCHNRSTAGVRSDCLECHLYHDRESEPTGLHGRMTIEDVLGPKRP